MHRRSAEQFFGRNLELRRLCGALRSRESLLVSGPPGIGKTALVLETLSRIDANVARRCFYLSGANGLRDLLYQLLGHLFEAGDITLRRQLHREGVRSDRFRTWLLAQSTSRLRGATYCAFEATPSWVFLDHMTRFPQAMAKAVRELVRMRNTPVCLLARELPEREVGHIANLYWSDQQRLALGPLPEPDARHLLEACIERFDLGRLELARFRDEMLRLSGRVPGAIVKMCSLASHPRYQYGAQVKTKLVHIDSLVSGYNLDLRRPAKVEGA